MSSVVQTPTWFTCLKQNTRASLRLFCFPYAGGSPQLFRAWAKDLPDWVELYAANLPGRGNRVAEPPCNRLAQLTRALARGIEPHLDRRFAFFGHSMGALLAFELARRLRREREAEPAHLFVSGLRAPHLRDQSPPIHRLPDAEFLEKLRHLNGTPPEILSNGELMQFMLPILRADFEVMETYSYLPDFPAGCPLEAYGGLQDEEVGHEGLSAWRGHTTGPFAVRMFPGDHFFINTARQLVLQQVVRALGRSEAAVGR